MNNAPPSAQDSIDSPSSKDASRIAVLKSTAPPIGIAEYSLLRTILDEHATHETQRRARARLDATGTSTPPTPPSERVGQGDSDPTDSPRASPIGREKKRLKAKRYRSPLVDGSHRKTPVLLSSIVFQRQRRPPGIRKSCGPQRHGASPHMRHYQGPSTHGIEVVVISDSKPDD
ncbi:hypothetical protein VE00_00906 [Pseudogymnoascus sp. WSF 3629]|nr:hypothetical protein VE00_00906 [Pseudogymnoascus sp. WSF 3629]